MNMSLIEITIPIAATERRNRWPLKRWLSSYEFRDDSPNTRVSSCPQNPLRVQHRDSRSAAGASTAAGATTSSMLVRRIWHDTILGSSCYINVDPRHW